MVVILGGDPVSSEVEARLAKLRDDVVRVEASEVAELVVGLGRDGAQVGGRTIAGVLLREPPERFLAQEFAESDRAFAAAEVRATWLDVCHAGAVLAINRLDAEMWFRHCRWIAWRQRLAYQGVNVSPVHFGDVATDGGWAPYSGGPRRPTPARATRRSLGTALMEGEAAGEGLFVCGEDMSRECAVANPRLGQVLSDAGVALASVVYDAAGRVISVDLFPHVHRDHVDEAANRLSGQIHDHLHRW